MATSFALFDLFRQHLPEEVARELAERLSALDRLATKADVDTLRAATTAKIDGLRTDVDGLRTDVDGLRTNVDRLRTDFSDLRTDVRTMRSDLMAHMSGVETSIYRWMLTFNATLFLGIAGMIVAIVLKG